MKKKFLMLISLLVLISSFILINWFQKDNFAVFNTVDQKRADHVKETLQKTEELDFTALLCNEIRLPFDDATNTFFVPLDRTEEQWEKMEFISGQPEYQILFVENVTDSDKAEVIAEGKRFPVIVYNDQIWAEYYVTFSGLPVIDLATNEGFYAEEEITGTAKFYDTDFTLHGILESDYNGHIRGNTSRMFPKKGYKLNLRTIAADGSEELNKLSLFGMRKDDDWILHALYNDDTKIRDMLSIEVWDAFGAGSVSETAYYGSRMTYVEVIADNSYCGLYALMEPVDAKQLELEEEDYLYKRKNSGGLDFASFDEEDDPYTVVNGFEIKAGVMDEEAWQPMANLAWMTYLSSEEIFDQQISETIDVDNALRLWLFIQIITGHDHTAKNVFYVAKYDESLPNKYKFYFAPWDMDLTWGNVSVGEVNPYYTDYEKDTMDNYVKWKTGDQLIEKDYNGSLKYVQQLYEELRASVISNEEIEALIYSIDDEIRNTGAFARDKERWPEGLHAQNCEELISYALGRLEFLDDALYNFEYFDD